MPRRLPVLALSLLLAGCTITPGGLSGQQLSSALPSAAEVGSGWTLVGTTSDRPQGLTWDDALTEAASGEPDCHAALTELEALQEQADPARFARSVYREPTSGAGSDRDLTLTLETYDSVPDRATAVREMNQACADTSSPLRTRAGVRRVTMTVSPLQTPDARSAGYSVHYQTDDLEYSFDYLVATRDRALVTATVTGPSSEANRQLLQQVVTLAAGNLDRARGGQPT